MNRCKECRRSFSGESWQSLCKDCFKESMEAKREQELASAEYLADLRGYRRGLRDGRAGQKQLDDKLLRDIIALCHPDRHPGRQELAHKVTVEINLLRERS